MLMKGNKRFEFVRFAGKASTQISQHVKNGVTEDFVRNKVLYAPKNDREYLPDGSFKLVFKVRKGRREPILVKIYVRERKHNNLVEYVIYGVHVRRLS